MGSARGVTTVLLTGVILVGFLGASCAPAQTRSGPASAPSGDGAPAAAAPVVPLKIAFSAMSFAQMALPVALDTGIFQKYGLDVELSFGPNGIPALIAGEVPVSVGSVEDVITADLSGADLIVVAAMVPYLGHKFLVRPEIQAPADLRGKVIGLSKRGTLSETVARMAAQRAGLDPERDWTMIELGTPDKQVAAMAAGSVVASNFSPPNSDVVEANGARVLYDFRAEQIEYPAAAVTLTRAWAARNEATVLNLLRAIAEAVQLAYDQPDRVAEIYARWAQTGAAAGKTAVATMQESVPVKSLPTAQGIRRIQETVAQQVPAAATADPARFYDDRYVRQLDQEGFYARLAGS